MSDVSTVTVRLDAVPAGSPGRNTDHDRSHLTPDGTGPGRRRGDHPAAGTDRLRAATAVRGRTVVGATKFALYVKSNTLRGGFAQNINLDGFSGTFDRAFSFVQMDYNNQTGDHPPAFGPFAISRSSCTHAPIVFDVSGLPGDHVNGFTVRDCAFNGVIDPADEFRDVDGVGFKSVTINGTPVTS